MVWPSRPGGAQAASAAKPSGVTRARPRSGPARRPCRRRQGGARRRGHGRPAAGRRRWSRRAGRPRRRWRPGRARARRRTPAGTRPRRPAGRGPVPAVLPPRAVPAHEQRPAVPEADEQGIASVASPRPAARFPGLPAAGTRIRSWQQAVLITVRNPNGGGPLNTPQINTRVHQSLPLLRRA
jgi:hypothetical protein